MYLRFACEYRTLHTVRCFARRVVFLQEAFGLGLGMDVEAHSFLQEDTYISSTDRGKNVFSLFRDKRRVCLFYELSELPGVSFAMLHQRVRQSFLSFFFF